MAVTTNDEPRRRSSRIRDRPPPAASDPALVVQPKKKRSRTLSNGPRAPPSKRAKRATPNNPKSKPAPDGRRNPPTVRFSTAPATVREVPGKASGERTLDPNQDWVRFDRSECSHRETVAVYWQLDCYRLYEMVPSLAPAARDSVPFEILRTPALRASVLKDLAYAQATALSFSALRTRLARSLAEFDPDYAPNAKNARMCYDRICALVAAVPTAAAIAATVATTGKDGAFPPSSSFNIGAVSATVFAALVPKLATVPTAKLPQVLRLWHRKRLTHAARWMQYALFAWSGESDERKADRDAAVRLAFIAHAAPRVLGQFRSMSAVPVGAKKRAVAPAPAVVALAVAAVAAATQGGDRSLRSRSIK
ncbi:hypothetical protein BC828DRAFT_7280 [Blastocladiella britannica]|nr:hypothetical protein BC828DRAFT_7280 [Blastocladiella britannica]